MLEFIAKRLGSTVLTMVVASFLVFVVVEFSPGNVASKILGPFASERSKEILFEKMKLNDSLPVRYGRWVGVLFGLLEDPLSDPNLALGYEDKRGSRYLGNLGYSLYLRRPVNDVIWERLANTALLAGIAFGLIVVLAMILGVIAGVREGTPLDRVISTSSVALTSIPEFASAVFLTAIFVAWLGWLPGTSNLEMSADWSLASQLVLPVAVLVSYDLGYVLRIVRGSVAATMQQPYIRTAILKGLSFRTVVLVHVLRNAMITPFTVILLQINWLVTGVVVTEVVFAFPGFGRMLVEAALFGDIALVEAATLVALFLASMTQFLGDVAYMYLNPKIRV